LVEKPKLKTRVLAELTAKSSYTFSGRFFPSKLLPLLMGYLDPM